MRRKVVLVIILMVVLCFGCLTTGARAETNTDEFKAWSSYDTRWSNKMMNGLVPMGGYGCLVTSVAKLLVQAGLTMPDGSAVDPGKLCDWLNANNGFVSKTGWYIWAKAYSFGFSNYTDNLQQDGTHSSAENNDNLINLINEGWHIILQINGGGHWIAIDEAKTLETGTVYIMDSDSNINNNANVTLVSRYATYTGVRAYKGGTTPFPNGKEMPAGGSRVLPDGDYIIANAGYSGKPNLLYLDYEGAANPAANGTNTIITGPVLTDSIPEVDVWRLTWLGNGYYKLTQKGTDMALNVQDGSVKSGTNIAAHPYAGHKNEQWAISFNGSNGYRIQARHSGFNIGLGSSPVNGANVQQSVGSGTASQGWLFIPYKPAQPVANGEYVLLSDVNLGRELDVPGDTGDVADNTKLQIWDESADGYYNAFSFTKMSNGYYSVIHVASGKAMEVYGGTSSVNDRVNLYTANGSSPQYWALIPNGSNKYELVVQSSGYALDLANAATANGSPVRQYPRNQSAAQTWHLRPAYNNVTYNANGGSGAPAGQKKYFMHNLTLSNTVPSRAGHVFLGWGFSPSDTIPAYLPGAIFDLDIDEDTTLYAVWDINKPGVRVSITLDGKDVPAGTTVGTFDAEVFSDGYHDKKQGATSYFVELIQGSRYSISNITAAAGYQYTGISGGAESGTIGDSVINIVLNFTKKVMKTQGLRVQFTLDGAVRESLAGIGTFDVDVTGSTLSIHEQGCVSFSRDFSESCNYTINVTASQSYVFTGVSGGPLSGSLDGETRTIVLAFETSFVPQKEWQELSELPGNIDPEMCDIEYRNHYVYQGSTSPGDGWTMTEQGTVQYENDGDPYNSDDPLETSELRVQVGYYYFHWCGDPADVHHANYFKRPGVLEFYHMIPTSQVGEFEITSQNLDGDRYYYTFKNLTGQWVGGQTTCPEGCKYYYKGYVYQNRKACQMSTYVRDSDWTSERDPAASSASVRVRLRSYFITLYGNGAMCGSTLLKFHGEDADLGAWLQVCPMTNDGYLLTGWNTEPDGSGTAYEVNAIIKADANLNLYAQWEAITTAVLPRETKTIKEEAFAGSGVRIVRIPYGCTAIRARAFAGCRQLKKIYIPSTVMSIDSTAFEGLATLVIVGEAESYAEFYASKRSWISFETEE